MKIAIITVIFTILLSTLNRGERDSTNDNSPKEKYVNSMEV